MDAASYAPQMGAVPSEFSGSPRMLIVRSYVIFYEPLAEGDGIAICPAVWAVRLQPCGLAAATALARAHSDETRAR